MKILFFIDGLRLGGKERRLIELLKGLKNHPEFEIVVASVWKDIHYKEFYQLDIPIFFIEKKRKLDPSIFYKFYNLTRKIKPDIVHTWSSMNTSYSIIAKIFSNFKLINSQITNAPNIINWLSQFGIQTKLNFLFSDIILANSKTGLLSYHVPISKSRWIHNGFDFSRIEGLEEKEKIRERFEIKTEKVVGMVASFSDTKDYKTYIKAAKLISAKRNDVTFLAVGNGVNFEKAKGLAENCSKIVFTGKQQYVESIVNIFDIGVLSTYTEGISNSIMEYMALAKPVIATDGGGTKELIRDGETGFLVKANSPEKLASKIEYLLDNDKLASSMGKKAKERIKKEFSMEKMINAFVDLYGTLRS